MIEVPAWDMEAEWLGGSQLQSPIWRIISGPSPRFPGTLHAVVGCNGKIVHDPHPDKTGLAGDPNTWAFTFLSSYCCGPVVPSMAQYNQRRLSELVDI